MNNKHREIRPAPNKLVGWSFEDEILRRSACRNALGFVERRFKGIGKIKIDIINHEY